MHIERNDDTLHSKLVDGKLILQSYLTNALDGDLEEAMIEWVHGEGETTITTNFTLSDALDTIISLHEMRSCGGALDIKAKPLVDAMRAELAEMIAKIDTLKFADPVVDAELDSTTQTT